MSVEEDRMSGNTGLRIAGAVLLTLLLVSGAAAIGYMAYQAGVANGAAQSGVQVVAPAAAPMPYYGYPVWYGPFGFMWCLGPLFFLFLLFFAMRLAFGGWRRHGPWGWHGRKWGSEDMREHWMKKAEEWHREQHGASGT
jgi:hypothetical protein